MSKHKHTKEQIEKAVSISKSWAEVCRILQIPPATGSQSHLTKKAKKLGINYSHFLGQSWNKGRKFPESKPLEEYLIKNSTIKSATLRKKLIRKGIKEEKCEVCGITQWNNKPAPLELDHKNSDHWDNRIENLQVLCPNCHAQITIERRSTPFGERTDLESVEAKAIAGSIPVSGTKFCIPCGKEISRKATKCKSCAIRNRGTKINWPTKNELTRRLQTQSYLSLAKELKVSDNAIRKHLKTIEAYILRR